MVSFDVESLFTNIPLLESIELAVGYILSRNPNIKLSKNSLKELALVATAQTHFLFQANCYDQYMASPWAPHWHQYLPIFSWASMKEFGSNNTMVL